MTKYLVFFFCAEEFWWKCVSEKYHSLSCNSSWFKSNKLLKLFNIRDWLRYKSVIFFSLRLQGINVGLCQHWLFKTAYIISHRVERDGQNLLKKVKISNFHDYNSPNITHSQINKLKSSSKLILLNLKLEKLTFKNP